VLAAIALFVALGGSAAALSGRNTVFSDDITNHEVKKPDLDANSVTGGKVVNDSLTGSDVAESSLQDYGRTFGAADDSIAGDSSDSVTLTVPGTGSLAVHCTNGGTTANDADDAIQDFTFINQSGATAFITYSLTGTNDLQAVDSPAPLADSSGFSIGAGEKADHVSLLVAPAGASGGGPVTTFTAGGAQIASSENCRAAIQAVKSG
jgi:hypothetical protein